MIVEVRTVRFGNLSIECQSNSKVSWLREEVAKRLSVRSSEQIVLVSDGKAMSDKDTVAVLPGGSVLATVRPGLPSGLPEQSQSHSRPDDDEASFRLPANASPRIQRAAGFLQKDLHFPDLLLALIFQTKSRVWAFILLWLCGAKLSSWYSLGPLYIIGTIATLIFLNLGQRREGEASAYSIFNNFRALPGQLTADQLDQQVRRGQMG